MTRIPSPPELSEQAIEKATGVTWAQWYTRLDAAGARTMTHKEIVAWIAANTDLDSGWWQQSITVQYEKAAGLRADGQTANRLFQYGVRRTVAVDRQTLWSFICSSEGMAALLGCAEDLPADTGELLGGNVAELRVRVECDRARLRLLRGSRWPGSTLQLRVDDARSGTTFGVHHENLADEGARDAARDHFTSALEALRGRFA